MKNKLIFSAIMLAALTLGACSNTKTSQQNSESDSNSVAAKKKTSAKLESKKKQVQRAKLTLKAKRKLLNQAVELPLLAWLKQVQPV